MLSPRTPLTRFVFVAVLSAIAVTAFAQSANSRAYRRTTISKGSPAKPLTGPAAGRPVDIAKEYTRTHGKEVDLTAPDVADLVVTGETRSDHTGITHVYLRQRRGGIEIFGADSNFNIAANGSILSFGTSFLPEIEKGINRSSPVIGAVAAANAAAANVGLEVTEPLEPIEVKVGPEQETVLTAGGIASSPIVAKLVYQPVAFDALRLAWQIDLDETSGQHLWRMTVDAETGEVLNKEDYVMSDNWDVPSQGRGAPFKPASEAKTLGRVLPLASPTPVFDGSSYRVFALPKESPNDGPRTLVANPADASASPFGWHDTNGIPGAEFTITRGNNVHAYLDQDANNAADFGFDVNGGLTLTFDFPADLNEHAQNYREAVTTNLFYWNSIFHDVMWRYGFNEASGNFQANNYGRGGTGGDYVRAEAADGAGTNNANFSTPVETAASGGTPRMQMFLWPGNQFGAQNQVVVTGLGSFNGSWARFSPAPSVAGTSGQIMNAGNGCVAADYAAAPAGDWMAIVTGNNTVCQNIQKARTASTAGAKALIVAHTTTAAAPILTGSLTTAPPTIPVVSITLADGNAIRAALPATGTVRKHPDHPGIRDGDFENGIIIHEYGHGVSNRLTGGPAVNCLSGDEQAGEGWSDYFAITILLDPALDDPETPRGMGPYALFQDSRQGAGIRPRPYSRDMAIQPFTYDSIKTGGWLNGTSLAVPHGVGHGWAAILWDMNWDLIEKHGFNPDLYAPWNSGGNNRSLQYVTDGLKLQGCSPGFVAARNGIIAATEALGGEDTCTVWAAFARRGLGYSAVQGSTDGDDNTEAFDTHPSCRGGVSSPVANEPTINVVNVGSTVPVHFTYPGNHGLDILASDSPYSRQVECSTLRTLDPTSPFITPRPIPVPTQTPGNSGLSETNDEYTYPWKTESQWGGTCREFVLTRKDGVQHRAYFFFDSRPSFAVSGFVRDTSGQPVPNAAVTIVGSSYGSVTTDATGFYAFPAVARGTYSATAAPVGGGGCQGSQTQEFTVSRDTTLNFTLPDRVDAFGYSCRNVAAGFEEAANLLLLTGDDVSTTIDLPFPVTFYGSSYTRAHVCTNGYVEFVGPTTGTSTCPTSGGNATIPSTGRPNGAVLSFWDDVFVDPLASIRTEVKGTTPNRRFVIEYRNLHFFGDVPTTRRVDFNTVLFENGQIMTQYRNIADDGRERGNSATIGIENEAGTIALRYSFNTAVLAIQPAVTSIRYTPPPLFAVSGQVRDGSGNPAPNVSVTLTRTPLVFTTTTDAGGFYSFPAVPEGSYTATALQSGCVGQTQTVAVSADTTLNFTLGDLSDTYGYRCRQETAAFEEANAVVPISGDDVRGVVATIDIGFPFTFYGQTYTQAYVCTNGFIEFVGPATGNCTFTNVAIPATARPNGAVYSFWDDLFVDALASIRTELKGAAPNRRFVVEFRNMRFFGDLTRRIDFNIVLHENGEIQTQHRNLANDARERGSSATVGIENETGTVALRFSFNQAVLPFEPAVNTIRFRPPGIP